MRPVPLVTLFLALGAAALSPAAAAGQTAQTVPVRAALEDRDGDRVPDRLGDTVTVEGILIRDPLVLNPNASLVNFQDATGGVVLFTRDTTVFRGLARGDSLRVRGRIGQYLGAEQLLVDGVERLGRAELPAPRDVVVSDLEGEALFGQLVRAEGTLTARQTEAGWVDVEIRDSTGSIPVYISSRWLTDPGFMERLTRGGEGEVVGIASQDTGADPPADGYRLVPRTADDFEFAMRPPLRLLAAITVGLLILGLGWWQRRERRRARELEELARKLRRSQDELRAREERFRSLVENAADTVSILDPSGRVLYHSPSVRRMLGWNPEDLQGRDLLDLVHPSERDEVEAALAELTEDDGEEPLELEFRIEDVNGSWHRVEVTGTNRLHDPAVRGIVCNMRDVTQHRQLEQRVRNADRMEAVGRLAGGVAHDFNNVLTALRGHAELALEEMDSNMTPRHELEEIVRSSERAAALTRQLLTFSRQQVMQPKLIVPTAVVEGMLPMLRRLIGEDIELVTEIEPEVSAVRVDPVHMEQVIMNLVVNARDAMPDGGRMTLRLTDDRISPEQAAGYPYPVNPGAYVRFSVTDTGLGMEEDVLSHVFDPFFTTKDQGDGTGLGLATLYGIVKQSSGYVWARSEPGRGSRFDVYLPHAPGDARREAPDAAGDGARQRGRGETILLVEDEDGVRRLARRVLEKNGYRVLEADDPTLALDMVRDRAVSIDLLFTDVVMPGMSGGELAERLREIQPDLLTLFTSGYTEDHVVRRGVMTGEAEFLEKPFTPDQLLRRIQRMLVLGRTPAGGASESG
mgnify:CR=1 FL=1